MSERRTCRHNTHKGQCGQPAEFWNSGWRCSEHSQAAMRFWVYPQGAVEKIGELLDEGIDRLIREMTLDPTDIQAALGDDPGVSV